MALSIAELTDNRYEITLDPAWRLEKAKFKSGNKHWYEWIACKNGGTISLYSENAVIFKLTTKKRTGEKVLQEVKEAVLWIEFHDEVEILFPSAVIHQVAENLAACEAASMSTVCTPITTTAELFDPHVVKVVMDAQGLALYFSRASIPWDREAFANTAEVMPDDQAHFRHIGLYAYRAGFLREFSGWSQCPLEQMESLEQLRALWHGHRIHVAEAVEVPQAGVDTERDLDLVRSVLAKQ